MDKLKQQYFWRESLLPHPFFSLIFLFFWLCLNGWSLADFCFGLFFSISLGQLQQHLALEPTALRAKIWLFILFYHVMKSLFISHKAALFFLWQNLKPQKAALGPKIIRLELQLKERQALALLFCVTSLAPGALWISYDEKEHIAQIHLLNSQDESRFRYEFYHIYQRLLGRIFSKGQFN